MDVETVIALAAETFGTLSPRASRSTLPSIPAHPLKKATVVESTIQTNSPKATVWIAWVIPGSIDVTVSRRLDLMATILNDRIRSRIREDLGATYDASAFTWESQSDPGFGLLITKMTTPPSEARRFAALVRQISSDMAKNGVNADEFQRARQPIIAGFEQHMRDNGYWLYGILAEAQEHPDHLDWPRTRERDYRAMVPEEINLLAREYLRADRACSLLVTPKSQ
jgi:zinc protease